MTTINKQAVEELVELLNTHHLQEVEYQQNDLHIKVVAAHAPAQPVATQPVASVATTATEQPSSALPLDKAILAPIVGVAYLSTTPGGEPLVHVGDKVKVGQTLCLIEAMKTFNPIKATRAGTVTQILIEDATPVEYNEPLLIVE
ncbi:MAG: acetyl-CoA carboxylase biotin carboxyl carrier protein [Alphaproteobacteria bacterium]|nr:acetyl-CoA carboxylase biotin carboxyl carrier protein [Alphaproteobacteria bacterium]